MSSNSLFQRFREPVSSVPVSDATSETYRNRHNYMVLANIVELATSIVHESLSMSDGVKSDGTINKMSRVDISDLVCSQTMAHIEANRGELK